MIISTIYSLGDRVVAGCSVSTSYWIPCPECDGTGYHKVEGKDLRLRCTTCNSQGNWNATPGQVVEYKWAPHIEHLTISQVRAEVSKKKTDHRYMCEETGIGSGTVWAEGRLWPVADLPVLKERLEKRCEDLNSGKASSGTGYDKYLSWEEEHQDVKKQVADLLGTLRT